GFVDLESLGMYELKGIDRLVEVHRVVGATDATSRYEAWADPSTPLIGRREELTRLTAAIEQSGGDRGSLTVVTGEAGIGKSRLIHEARARLAARLEVLACSGVEMATSEPLAPIRRLFLAAGGVKTSEPDAYDQLVRILGAHGVAPASIARVATSIGVETPADLVLAPQTPEQTLRDITAAYIAWLAGVSSEARALLVVDDLHWLDATSRELLLRLPEAAPELAIVVATRPSINDPLVGAADHVIDLPALTADETGELLAWFVGSTTGEVDYTDAISRSDGIPLFAEELGRVLTEQGSTALAAIPTTLHDLLAMRLDAMPEAKQVAQVAATIGRDFDVDVLESVLDPAQVREHMPALLESGVWMRGGRPGAMAFRHALLADAAYDSQVRSRKVEVNRQVADSLLADFPARVAATPHQVAHHREAGEQYDDALALWLQAGMATAGIGAHVEAMEHYRRGLAILDHAEEGPMRLQIELGLRLGLGASISSTAGYGHPDVQTGFARAQEICSLFGSLPDLFPAVWGSWSFYLVTADYDTAASLAADISAIAAAADDPALAMEAAAVEGITAFYRGDLAAADDFFATAEALFEQNDEVSSSQQFQHPVVAALSNAALVRWLRGDALAAVSAIRRAVEIAENCDPRLALFARGYAATFGGALGSFAGDAAMELEHAQEAIDVCHEFGSQMFLAGGEMYKGHAQAATGSEAEGLARLEAAAEGYVMTGALLMRPYHLSCVADVKQSVGDLDAACAVLDEALSVGERVGERAFVPHVRTRRAELEIARSGSASDDVVASLRQAVDEAAANGDVMTQLRALGLLNGAGLDHVDALASLLAEAPALDPDHPVVQAARAAVGQ
ncbi:MAG: AAA family ATPase, partial [Actinomycetota bacterium]